MPGVAGDLPSPSVTAPAQPTPRQAPPGTGWVMVIDPPEDGSSGEDGPLPGMPAPEAALADGEWLAIAGDGQDLPSAAFPPSAQATPRFVDPRELEWAQWLMWWLGTLGVQLEPAAPRQHGGVARMLLVIDAAGQVREASLRSSSGNPDLDAQALAIFDQARQAPVPPPHLPSPVRVDVPVVFGQGE